MPQNPGRGGDVEGENTGDCSVPKKVSFKIMKIARTGRTERTGKDLMTGIVHVSSYLF